MCDITFRDVEAPDDFAVLLERKLDDLQEFAPSDAVIHSLIFKALGGSYRGIVEVAFTEGRFIAEGASEDLEALTDSLIENIETQIEGWRETRFKEDLGDGFRGERAWYVAA